MANTRSVNTFASPNTQQKRRREPKFIRLPPFGFSPRHVGSSRWLRTASLHCWLPSCSYLQPASSAAARVLAVSSPCRVPTIARSAAEAHERSDPRDEKRLARSSVLHFLERYWPRIDRTTRPLPLEENPLQTSGARQTSTSVPPRQRLLIRGRIKMSVYGQLV